MSQRPGDMSSQYLSGQLGWNPRQQNLPPLMQTQGSGSMGNPFIGRAQPAGGFGIDFAQHLNAQRDAQIGMQNRLPIDPNPFGQSLRQENPYRPSPPRRGPGGFGGGGFGGGSQGLDQFMDFIQQMMDMFKQFNSQGGGGGYGQRRNPGFPQSPWASSQRYGQYQPQPARLETHEAKSGPMQVQIRTRGPESLNAQLRPHEGVYPGAPQTLTKGNPTYNPIWEHGGPGEATLQMARPT